MRLPTFAFAGLYSLLLAGAGASAAAQGPALAPPSAARKAELIRLVRQDCGSCHGMALKGGLGPPLLPETLRDKPRESLLYTILLGRPGTAMPPWKTFLSEAEANWIVSALSEGFPEEQDGHAGLRSDTK